jgi:hypothetical protein
MTATLDDVTVEQIQAKLLTLSEGDRRRLYDVLAESLGMEWVEEWPPEVIAEWERRSDAIDRGEAKLIPGDEVMAKLLAKYQQ